MAAPPTVERRRRGGYPGDRPRLGAGQRARRPLVAHLGRGGWSGEPAAPASRLTPEKAWTARRPWRSCWPMTRPASGKWISPPLPVRPGASYRCPVVAASPRRRPTLAQRPRDADLAGPDGTALAPSVKHADVDRGRPAFGGAEQLRRSASSSAGCPTAPSPSHETPAGSCSRGLVVRAPARRRRPWELEGWLRFAPARDPYGTPARAWEEVPARPPHHGHLGHRASDAPAGKLARRQPAGPGEAGRSRRAAADYDAVCLPENALIDGTGLTSAQATGRRWRGPPWVCSPGPPRPAGSGLWCSSRSGRDTASTTPRRCSTGEGASRTSTTRCTSRRESGSGGSFQETGRWWWIRSSDGLGVLICFDLHFPEGRRQSPPWQGPRWIFGPTVGDRWPGRRDAGTRAHALANGVFVVTSLVRHPSEIVDPEGRLLARTERRRTPSPSRRSILTTRRPRRVGPRTGHG